jgi:hypothetical protein
LIVASNRLIRLQPNPRENRPCIAPIHIAWKTNRRNYRLLCRHLAAPRRHTGRDWAFLLLLAAALALVFAIPLALVV